MAEDSGRRLEIVDDTDPRINYRRPPPGHADAWPVKDNTTGWDVHQGTLHMSWGGHFSLSFVG